MNRSLWISASGMECEQLRTDNIANNMANVNTTAFKRGVSHFEDMLYQTLATPGAENTIAEIPAGIQIGSGARVASVSKVFNQGAIQQTGAYLDLAIQGDGFFQVTLPDGTTAYTRDGHFQMNTSGQVVNNEGYSILNFPTLNVNATQVTIDSDGTVSQTVDGTTSQVGQIQLSRFANPSGLKFMGRNMYAETTASGTPTSGAPADSGFGLVSQYYLENSNVEIVKEMVDMIAAQRAYELNSKGIKTASDMLRIATNLK